MVLWKRYKSTEDVNNLLVRLQTKTKFREVSDPGGEDTQAPTWSFMFISPVRPQKAAVNQGLQ